MAKKTDKNIGINAPLPVLTQLQNVARQARTHTARHLLETGLYAGQEVIIQLLAEYDSLTPSEIAKALGVRPPTITKSIMRLSEQGFVARSTGHTDGRQVRVQLTEAGNNILKKTHRAARKADKQALKNLTKDETAQLRVLLNKVSGTLTKRDAKSFKMALKKTASNA